MPGLRCRAGHPPDDGATSPLDEGSGAARGTPRAGDAGDAQVLKSPLMLHPDEQAHQLVASFSASASPKPAPRGTLRDAIRGLQNPLRQHPCRDPPSPGHTLSHLDLDPLDRSSFAIPPRGLDFAALTDEAWNRAAEEDDAGGIGETCMASRSDSEPACAEMPAVPVVEILGLAENGIANAGQASEELYTNAESETTKGARASHLALSLRACSPAAQSPRSMAVVTTTARSPRSLVRSAAARPPCFLTVPSSATAATFQSATGGMPSGDDGSTLSVAPSDGWSPQDGGRIPDEVELRSPGILASEIDDGLHSSAFDGCSAANQADARAPPLSAIPGGGCELRSRAGSFKGRGIAPLRSIDSSGATSGRSDGPGVADGHSRSGRSAAVSGPASPCSEGGVSAVASPRVGAPSTDVESALDASSLGLLSPPHATAARALEAPPPRLVPLAPSFASPRPEAALRAHESPSSRSGAQVATNSSAAISSPIARQLDHPFGRIQRGPAPPHGFRGRHHAAADMASPGIDPWQSTESRVSCLPARHRPLELLFGHGDAGAEASGGHVEGDDLCGAEKDALEEDEGDEVLRAMLPSTLGHEVDGSGAERHASGEGRCCSSRVSRRSLDRGDSTSEGLEHIPASFEGSSARCDDATLAASQGDAGRSGCPDAELLPLRPSQEGSLAPRAAANRLTFNSPESLSVCAIPPNSPSMPTGSPFSQAGRPGVGGSLARPQSLFATLWFSGDPLRETTARADLERRAATVRPEIDSSTRGKVTAWEQVEAQGLESLARPSPTRRPATTTPVEGRAAGDRDGERADSPHESALTPLSQPMLTPQSGVRGSDVSQLRNADEDEAISTLETHAAPLTCNEGPQNAEEMMQGRAERSENGIDEVAEPTPSSPLPPAGGAEQASSTLRACAVPRASPSFHTAMDLLSRSVSVARSFSSRPAREHAFQAPRKALDDVPWEAAAESGAWSQSFVGALDRALDGEPFGAAESAEREAAPDDRSDAETLLDSRGGLNGVATDVESIEDTSRQCRSDAGSDRISTQNGLLDEPSEQESISGDVSSESSLSCADEEEDTAEVSRSLRESSDDGQSCAGTPREQDDCARSEEQLPATTASESQEREAYTSAEEGSMGSAIKRRTLDPHTASPLPFRRSAVRPRMLFGESMDDTLASHASSLGLGALESSAADLHPVARKLTLTGGLSPLAARKAIELESAATSSSVDHDEAKPEELSPALAPGVLSAESSEYVTAAPTRAASTVSPPASRPASAEAHETGHVRAAARFSPLREEGECADDLGLEENDQGGEAQRRTTATAGANEQPGILADSVGESSAEQSDEELEKADVEQERGGESDLRSVVDAPSCVVPDGVDPSFAGDASPEIRRLCKVAEKLERISLTETSQGSDADAPPEGAASEDVAVEEVSSVLPESVVLRSATDAGCGNAGALANPTAAAKVIQESSAHCEAFVRDATSTPIQKLRLRPRVEARVDAPLSPGPRSARRGASAEQAELALHQVANALDMARLALGQAEDALEDVRHEEPVGLGEETAAGSDAEAEHESTANGKSELSAQGEQDDSETMHFEESRESPTLEDAETVDSRLEPCEPAACVLGAHAGSTTASFPASAAASEPVSHNVSPSKSTTTTQFASLSSSPFVAMPEALSASSAASPLSSPSSGFSKAHPRRARTLKRSSKFERSSMHSTAPHELTRQNPIASNADPAGAGQPLGVTMLSSSLAPPEGTDAEETEGSRDERSPELDHASAQDQVAVEEKEEERQGTAPGNATTAIAARAGDEHRAVEHLSVVVATDESMLSPMPSSSSPRQAASTSDVTSDTAIFATPLHRTQVMGAVSSSLAVSNEATFALNGSIASEHNGAGSLASHGLDRRRSSSRAQLGSAIVEKESESFEATSTPRKGYAPEPMQSEDATEVFQSPLTKGPSDEGCGAMETSPEVLQRAHFMLSLSIPDGSPRNEDSADAVVCNRDAESSAVEQPLGAGGIESKAEAIFEPAPVGATTSSPGVAESVESEEIMEDAEETPMCSDASSDADSAEAPGAIEPTETRTFARLRPARLRAFDQSALERPATASPPRIAGISSPTVRMLSAESSAAGCPTDRSSVFSNPIFEDDGSRAEEEGAASSRTIERFDATPESRVPLRGLHSLGSRDAHRSFRDPLWGAGAAHASNRLASLPPPSQADDPGGCPETDRAQGHRFMRPPVVMPSLHLSQASRMQSLDSVPPIGDLCSPSPDPTPSVETSAGWGNAHHGAGRSGPHGFGSVPASPGQLQLHRVNAQTHVLGRRPVALPSAESIGPLLPRMSGGSGRYSEPSTGRAALEVLGKVPTDAVQASVSSSAAIADTAMRPSPREASTRLADGTLPAAGARPSLENSAEWVCTVVDAREEAERLAMDAGQIVDASRSVSRVLGALESASARASKLGGVVLDKASPPPSTFSALPERDPSHAPAHFETPEASSLASSQRPSSIMEVLADLPPVPTSVPASRATIGGLGLSDMPDVPSGLPVAPRGPSPRMVEVELPSGEVMLAPLMEEGVESEDENTERAPASTAPPPEADAKNAPAADDQVLGALLTVDSTSLDLSPLRRADGASTDIAAVATPSQAVQDEVKISTTGNLCVDTPERLPNEASDDVSTAPPSSQGLFESPVGKGAQRTESVATTALSPFVSPSKRQDASTIAALASKFDMKTVPANFDAAKMARAAEAPARPLGPMARAAASFKSSVALGALGGCATTCKPQGKRTALPLSRDAAPNVARALTSTVAAAAAAAPAATAVAATTPTAAAAAAVAAAAAAAAMPTTMAATMAAPPPPAMAAPAATSSVFPSASLGSLGPGPLSMAATGGAPQAVTRRPSQGLVESFAPPLGAAIAEREMRSRSLPRCAGSTAMQPEVPQRGHEMAGGPSSRRPLGARTGSLQMRGLPQADARWSPQHLSAQHASLHGSRALRHPDFKAQRAPSPQMVCSATLDEPKARHLLPGSGEEIREANAALGATNSQRFSTERSISFAHGVESGRRDEGPASGRAVQGCGVQVTDAELASVSGGRSDKGANRVTHAQSREAVRTRGVEPRSAVPSTSEPASTSELQSESFVTAMETPCSKTSVDKRCISTAYPSIDMSMRPELDDPNGDAERRFAEKVRMAQQAHLEQRQIASERTRIGTVRDASPSALHGTRSGYPTVDYTVPLAEKAAIKEALKPGRHSTYPKTDAHTTAVPGSSAAARPGAPVPASMDVSASFAHSSLGPDVSAAPHDLRAAVAAAVAPLVQRIALLEEELESARADAARASIHTDRLENAELELEAARATLVRTRRDVFESFTRGRQPNAQADQAQETRASRPSGSTCLETATLGASLPAERLTSLVRPSPDAEALRSPAVPPVASPRPKPTGSWAGGLPIPAQDDWEARLASRDEPEDEPLPSWVVKAFAERGAYGEGPSKDWAVLSAEQNPRSEVAPQGRSPRVAREYAASGTHRRRESSMPAISPRVGRELAEPHPSDFYPTATLPTFSYQHSPRSQHASSQGARRAPPVSRAYQSTVGFRDGDNERAGYDRRSAWQRRSEEWHDRSSPTRYDDGSSHGFANRSYDCAPAAPAAQRSYDRASSRQAGYYGAHSSAEQRAPLGREHDSMLRPMHRDYLERQRESLSPESNKISKRGFYDPFPTLEDSLPSGRIAAHRRATPPLNDADAPLLLSPERRADFRAWEANEETARKRRVNRRPVRADFVPLSSAAPLLGRRLE